MNSLTVIIPFYNAHLFANDIIDSLNNQQYKNFEILFIDDNSTDNTIDIIKNSKLSINYTILKSPYPGPGGCRNYGIEKSISDYITFIDFDDIVSNEYCKLLINETYKYEYDIIESLFYATKNNKVISKMNIEAMLHTNDRIYNLLNGKISLTCWGKLYKLSFLKYNNIKFYNDTYNCEDHFFVLDCYQRTKKISTVFKYLYNWRRNNASLTNSFSDVNIKPTIDSIKYRYNMAIQNDIFDKKIEKKLISDMNKLIEKSNFKKLKSYISDMNDDFIIKIFDICNKK